MFCFNLQGLLKVRNEIDYFYIRTILCASQFVAATYHCVFIFYSFLFYSILFYSILFYSILFYSILLYSILFYSILFYSILFYSILFYSILFYSILFYSILFYSILFYSDLFYSILPYTSWSNSKVNPWTNLTTKILFSNVTNGQPNSQINPMKNFFKLSL